MSKNPLYAVVDQFVQALNEHDLGALAGLYAQDARLAEPSSPEAICGKPNVLKFYQTLFDAGIFVRLQGAICATRETAAFPLVIELNPGNGEMRIEAIEVLTFNEHREIASLDAIWGPENSSTP